jgi:hypothetical protein
MGKKNQQNQKSQQNQNNQQQGQVGGMAPSAVGAATTTTMADSVLMSIQDINMNPYLLGCAYILLNLGGRFMVLSVSPGQEAFLQNIVFRPLLLFAIMFIGTRNLVVAFWLTLVILIILHYLLNEESDWYLLAKHSDSA